MLAERAAARLVGGARVLLLTFALAACAPPGPANTPTVEVPPADMPAGEPAAAAFALDGEGLRFASPESGATRLVAFGTPEADAVAAVEAALGTPPERGENAECGAGPIQFASWPGGFALAAQQGTFQGWAPSGSGDDPSALTTMAGLGIGSTRTAFDAAYDAPVEASTLGAEFFDAGLSGILSGFDPGDRVEDLWAGLDCAFR